MSVPFYGNWTGRNKLGAHEAFSIESVQSILGILSYKWLTQVQSVARNNTATYATIFKLNKPKT